MELAFLVMVGFLFLGALVQQRWDMDTNLLLFLNVFNLMMKISVSNVEIVIILIGKNVFRFFLSVIDMMRKMVNVLLAMMDTF